MPATSSATPLNPAVASTLRMSLPLSVLGRRGRPEVT